MFTSLIKEITMAARQDGGDPGANSRLRAAVENAKTVNMPAANIERAIKRGTGELPGVVYEETTYEGYGPGGVALLIEIMTDNRNRTVADIRHILSKKGGRLGEAGSVAWNFETKGHILVERSRVAEDDLFALAVEAGAEDVNLEEEMFEIITSPADLGGVKQVLEENGIPFDVAEVTKLPKTTVRVTGEPAKKLLELMEALEDHDDVQHVYANFDITREVMEAVAQE